MKHLKAKGLTEENIIKAFSCLKQALPAPLGIGDDASVIPIGKNKVMLLSTDLLTQGIHFDPEFSSWSDVGYKSVVVNASDIFAMGAKPLYAWISISLPRDFGMKRLDMLKSGISNALLRYKMKLLGGDTTGSKSGVTICLTVAGFGKKNKIWLRSNAKSGDGIYITGPLGHAEAGLRLLSKNKKNLKSFGKLYKAHRRPELGYVKSFGLIKKLPIHSATDLSDGLSRGLWNIAKSSKKKIIIDSDKILMDKELIKAAELLKVKPEELAIFGGEDYGLLMTGRFKENHMLKRIGQVAKGAPGVYIRESDGKLKVLADRAFNHFG